MAQPTLIPNCDGARLESLPLDTPRNPDEVKREGWHEQGVLAVSADDHHLAWPECELVRHPGEKLHGPRPSDREARHG